MWLLLDIASPIVAAFAGFLLAAALRRGDRGRLPGRLPRRHPRRSADGTAAARRRSASAGAGPVRASGRLPTSRRRRRRLVGCEITRHAVQAYLSRHPEARPLGAIDHLE